ncbi:hypothetical protein [Streptomyces sp. NPDC000888]
MNAIIRQLLATADLLVAPVMDATVEAVPPATAAVPGVTVAAPAAAPAVFVATAASRCRGAAFALRAALETAVADTLVRHAAPHAIRSGSSRAGFLWLRSCTEAETARRARAAWSLLCLGCHYHQYEIGPTEDQIRAWRAEVALLIGLLSE